MTRSEKANQKAAKMAERVVRLKALWSLVRPRVGLEVILDEKGEPTSSCEEGPSCSLTTG